MEERDLSFNPVSNKNPKHLTTEQIAFYNERGYIFPVAIYDEAESTANREYFDMLLREMNAFRDGRDAYAINGYHIRCRGLWDIVTEPRILDYVEDIVGPNIIAWGTHFFCKLPHDPKIVPWHQDASYWPLSPARTMTVWLAIDDADMENAAMQFIPGTHRLGPLDWKNTDKPAVLHQEIVNIGQYGQPVADELKAGEISLHADMLAHGSTPNYSNRRRCGLTIRYCPPEVRPLNPSWAQQAMLCRGEDTHGHWTHNPRPEGEDLSPAGRPKSIGGN
ncbi:MAG TPA: phytanoyl-CoA dioxygenase family protein [Abditibacteriaceae bacterium]|nr:phytanoyl-CoA dioxygenase family protein [Abditibacteriaceae bacterium]